MSSASVTLPSIRYAMDIIRGRKPRRVAGSTVIWALPLEPFEGTGSETERLLRFGVGCAAELRAVVDGVFARRFAGLLFGDPRRFRSTHTSRERRQPATDRGGVVIDDMIHARWDRQSRSRRKCCVFNVNPRPDSLPSANNGNLTPPDLIRCRTLGRIPGAGPVEESVPQGDSFDVWGIQGARFEFGVGPRARSNAGAGVDGHPLQFVGQPAALPDEESAGLLDVSPYSAGAGRAVKIATTF